MDLNLQPLASSCFVTGTPFGDGERVISFLLRSESTEEVMRYDVAAAARERFTVQGTVACSWVHVFKPRKQGENPERELGVFSWVAGATYFLTGASSLASGLGSLLRYSASFTV